MSRTSDFRTYGSVEEAEKRLRQETLAEHAVALNNHADAIEELNRHHADMHAAISKLKDQMDCVLDGLYQNSQRYDALLTRLEALEKARG